MDPAKKRNVKALEALHINQKHAAAQSAGAEGAKNSRTAAKS